LFGIFLAFFQYLPTGMFMGNYFWMLWNKDVFFVNLGIAIRIGWILAIITQLSIFFLQLTYEIEWQDERLCTGIIPDFLGDYWDWGPWKSWWKGGNDIFPNSDIFLSGLYLGYVLTYCVVFTRFPQWTYGIGLMLLTPVPWAFVASGSVSLSNSILSFISGNAMGLVSLFVSFMLRKKCYYYFYCCPFFGRFFYCDSNRKRNSNRDYYEESTSFLFDETF
jgi:hypothetical protein